MPGSLDSCINSIYEPGNIPASVGTPPVRVLFRDALEAAISEAAAASDSVAIETGIDVAVSEAAAATDAPDGAIVSEDWALVNSWTHSTNVANVDFTGLAGYSDVRVVIRGLSASATAARQLLVSTDNGSSFMSSGYFVVATAGSESSATYVGFTTSTSSAAQTAEVTVSGWNLTAPKLVQQRTNTTDRMFLIPTASPLNALRVQVVAATLTGGSIYVFAR